MKRLPELTAAPSAAADRLAALFSPETPASIAKLQRCFKLGFHAASALMDELIAAGLVQRQPLAGGQWAYLQVSSAPTDSL